MSFARYLPTIRLVVFATASVLALIVMAMCAHLIAFTISLDDIYFTFSALGLATALMTMLTLPVMLVVDMLRKGAFTSFIAVELGWIGFLWIMWLATAALTADTNLTGGRCDQTISEFKTACGEINTIEAFAFLNWLALMGYFTLLLAFTIITNNNGNEGVWTNSVKYTDFSAPASAGGAPGEKITQANYQTPNLTGATVPTYPPPQQQSTGGYSVQPSVVQSVQPSTPQHPSYPQV